MICVNSTYELVRDLRELHIRTLVRKSHELPSRILFFLLAGDYSMRDFVTFFCRKKKDFKIGFLNHGTAGTPARRILYYYIYIYIYKRKESSHLYIHPFLSIFFLKLKRVFTVGTPQSL